MAETKEPEYTLNIFPEPDPETKKPSVAFVVQTTKVFVSFRYDILVSAEQDDRTIRLRIKGLHAPELLMPGSGPAIGITHLGPLIGHYHLVVVKQDKSENAFDIEVGVKNVTILRSPQRSFIALSTEPVQPQ